jgi:hypothetical protein
MYPKSLMQGSLSRAATSGPEFAFTIPLTIVEALRKENQSNVTALTSGGAPMAVLLAIFYIVTIDFMLLGLWARAVI